MGRKLVSTRPRAHTAGTRPKPPVTYACSAEKERDNSWPTSENGEFIFVSDYTYTYEPKRSNTFAGHGYLPKPVAISNTTPPFRAGNPSSRPRPSLPLNENQSIRHDMIGIALGSPTKDIIEPYPMTTTIVTASAMNSHKTDTKETDNGPRPEALRRKPSKWKKFGGLFRARSVEASLNSQYQTQANHQGPHPPRSRQASLGPKSQPKMPTAIDKPRSDSRPGTSQQPLSKQWGSSPSKNKETENSKKGKKHKAAGNPGKDVETKKHWGALAEEPEEEQKPSPSSLTSPSLLDVNIPNLEMERYSVMFGGVFGRPPRPNLLARRSRTLEHLRTEEEERLAVENDPPPLQRRSTTPIQTIRSPNFTLFPPTSATKTPKAPSPASPLPKTQIPLAPKTTIKIDEQPKGLPAGHSRWASESSFLSDTSDDESESGLDAVRLTARPPQLSEKEPDWEIINPPQSKSTSPVPTTTRKAPPFLEMSSSNTSRSTLVNNIQDEPTSDTTTTTSTQPPNTLNSWKQPAGAFPPRAASLRYTPSPNRSPSRQPPSRSKTTSKLNPPPPRHNFSSSIESIGDEMQPIEISVARSISVSKRHRQALVPVGAHADALTTGERLVPKRVGTPTQQAVQRGHRHEKSRVAVFEYA